MNSEESLGLALMIALFVALGFMVWAIYEGGKEWERFKTEHACKVVSKIDGDVFNTFGVSSNGQPVIGIGSTPGKTGWLCDDGVTYYK